MVTAQPLWASRSAQVKPAMPPPTTATRAFSGAFSTWALLDSGMKTSSARLDAKSLGVDKWSSDPGVLCGQQCRQGLRQRSWHVGKPGIMPGRIVPERTAPGAFPGRNVADDAARAN